MDDLIKDFLQESRENLDRLDQEFVKLESDPSNLDLLKSIFRTIHTIKGTCGFLGFTKLEALTHAGESLLSLLRDGELRLTEECTDVLLEMVDAVRGYLNEIEKTEAEGNADTSGLIAKLKKLQEQNRPKESAPPSPGAATEETPPRAAAKEKEKKETSGGEGTAVPPADAAAQAAHKPEAGKKKARPEVLPDRIGGALLCKTEVQREDIVHSLEMQDAGDARQLGEILVAQGAVSKQRVEDVARETRETKAEDAKDATIRVDVNLLEKQMNLVSELVLLRNRLLQLAVESNERNLNATVHGLNYVTSELRKNVMKTRMQPVSQLFDKLPRIVRDVSKDMGKKVRLETQGGNTELDKTLLEAIKDPVTHILRNSIDHGIETPENRRSQEKPEEGTVRVRAFHEGGNFHLELADDGAGIDLERVKQKALAKGLLTTGHAEKMTESEILNLIFLPGLSTAEKVTNVSGRGVGMDVVKTNIERIGGRAKLESVRRKGTTVSLEIPLTLATIPALTVVSGNSVFAVPQAALVEMIALDVEESQKCIESIDGVSVFRFRGTVLPLMSLREELKLKQAAGAECSIVKLVVVRTEGRQVALLVDAIRNTEEIVIKPLDKRFKSIALYSGAAVLGDGRVALILDIPAFVRRAGVVVNRELQASEAADAKRTEKVSLLLLAGSDGERMAVPLEYVQRLEEFAAAAKEPMGEFTVVQYRNEILPIVRLEGLLQERRKAKRTPEGQNPPPVQEKISAIVVRLAESRNIILEVHRILGITKVEIEKLTPPTRPGVRGSMVIQERVTELLDLPGLLAKSESLQAPVTELAGAGTEQ
jgi:two-component system chemotaxis sensor kinase CheA